MALKRMKHDDLTSLNNGILLQLVRRVNMSTRKLSNIKINEDLKWYQGGCGK